MSPTLEYQTSVSKIRNPPTMSGSKDSNSTKSSEEKIGANYEESALNSSYDSGSGTQLLATIKNKKFGKAEPHESALLRTLHAYPAQRTQAERKHVRRAQRHYPISRRPTIPYDEIKCCWISFFATMAACAPTHCALRRRLRWVRYPYSTRSSASNPGKMSGRWPCMGR